ncbi:unnamed protein product, partial [Rotaria sordida]
FDPTTESIFGPTIKSIFGRTPESNVNLVEQPNQIFGSTTESIFGPTAVSIIESNGVIQECLAQHYFKQVLRGMSPASPWQPYPTALQSTSARVDYSAFGYGCHGDAGLYLAALFIDPTTNEKKMLTFYCGTKPYISPEILSKAPYHAEPVDIWSSVFPWTEASHQILAYKRWLNDDYNDSPWEQIDNLILNLLRVILRDDPTERAKIIDIQSHQ